MRVLRSTGIVAAGFLIALSIPAAAAASRTLAPNYVSSEPEEGAMLDHPPEEVQVTFDEPLDPESTLRVEDECGRQIDDGNVTVQVTQMTVGIELTPSGDYKVTWLAKGIAGATGQNTGSFSFMVHHGSACDGGGGGHDDHDGTDDDKHRGHDDRDRHDGHDEAGHDETGHDPVHDTMDHDLGMSMDHDAAGHAGMDHSQMKHAKKKHGKHANHKAGRTKTPSESEPDRAQAGPLGDPPIAPNGTAVVLALGLSLAMGGVGGWFLRVSGGP